MVDLGPSEPAPRQPWGPNLDPRQRMMLAKLSGAVNRWFVGELHDRPGTERRDALLAYTTDPLVWGVILGRALRRLEVGQSPYAAAVEFARAVGADEDAAAVHLAWLRAQPGL